MEITDNEKKIKIDSNYLEKINKMDNRNKFGNWINNVDTLREEFLSGKPFENVVIDNFLEESALLILYNY